MIRAVIVDDEKPALDKLSRLLDRQPNVEVVGAYMSPNKALEEIFRLRPDAVFLDIKMPGFSGLQIAEAVRVMSGESSVVFVTAYSQYAVDAFGVEATDYLVKPVTEDRLVQTLKRLEKKHRPQGKEWTKHLLLWGILTLGPLELVNASGDTLGVNWRTSKTRELFALLVHHWGTPLKKDKIIEWLWPEIEREKGSTLFHTTIYNLRKALQTISMQGGLHFSNNRYVFDLGEIKCDKVEFSSIATQKIDGDAGRLEIMKRAIDLYRGDYFEEEDYDWAFEEQKRLRYLYLGLLQQVVQELIRCKAYIEAEGYLEKLVKQDPLNKDAQCSLMEIFAERGNRDRLVRQFEEYKKALKEELDIEPEQEVQLHLYQLLKNCL